MKGFFSRMLWVAALATVLGVIHAPGQTLPGRGVAVAVPMPKLILAQGDARDEAGEPGDSASGPSNPPGADAPQPGGETPEGADRPKKGFVPTEKIDADQAVDFPADI